MKIKKMPAALEFSPRFSNAIKFIAGLAFCAACTAHANTYTWQSGSNWTSAGNWSSGGPPLGSDIAEFDTVPGGGSGSGIGPQFTAASTNNGSFTGAEGALQDEAVGLISVTSARTSSSLYIGTEASGTGGYMTLDGTTFNTISNTVISNFSATTALNFAEDVNGKTGSTFGLVLGGTNNVVQTAVGTATANGSGVVAAVTIDQALGVTAALTLDGNGTATASGGTLELGDTDSFTGGVTANGGAIQFDGAYAMPTTGTMTVNTNGQFIFNAAGTYGAVGQSLVLNGTGTDKSDGALQTSGRGETWQGTTTFGSNVYIDVTGASGTATLSGAVTDGTYQLQKQGGGNLVLGSNSNNMTGSTLIANGTLSVNSGSTMGSGALTLAPSANANDPQLVLNNAAQSIGNLTSNFSGATSGTQVQVITLNSTALNITESGTTIYGSGVNTASETETSSIAGTGSLILSASSSGALALTGTETYSGGTQIKGGALYVDGSLAGSSGTDATVSVTGGTLAGSGSIGGLVTATGGTVTTGSAAGAVGLLTLGNGLNMSGGGTYLWQLNSDTDDSSVVTSGTAFDDILLSGSLTLGGASALSLDFTYGPDQSTLNSAYWQSAHSWTIISGTSGSGVFSSISTGATTAPDGSFSTSDSSGVVTLNYTVVPEPATWLCLCVGVASLPALRKRRRQ